MAALGQRDDMAGNGDRPNVKAEHLRSKYELSVLQQVILLHRLPSWPYVTRRANLSVSFGKINIENTKTLTCCGRDNCECCPRFSTSALTVK